MGPDGFRGWGGGNTEDAVIGVDESSRSYLPGPITPGTSKVVIGKVTSTCTGSPLATMAVDAVVAATAPGSCCSGYLRCVADGDVHEQHERVIGGHRDF